MVTDLDQARVLLENLAGQHAVLGKLARGELSAADLPQLQRAASEMGLETLSEALRRLGAGHSPAAILAYLVGTGDFPDLLDRLSALRGSVDDLATVARSLGYGRRP